MFPLVHQKLQDGTEKVRDGVDILLFEFPQEHGNGLTVHQIEEFALAGEAIMENTQVSVGAGAHAPGGDGGHPLFQGDIERRPNQARPPFDGRDTRRQFSSQSGPPPSFAKKEGAHYAHPSSKPQISLKRTDSPSYLTDILRNQQ